MPPIMQQMKNNSALADIHTHILPAIDDGAKNADEAIKLLISEQRQGVTDVVLTPHFSLAHHSIDEFLRARNTSFDILREKIKETEGLVDINLYLGAEVRYDPNLIYTDIYRLCIENTSYLLLELSGSFPFNFEQTVHWLLSQGVTPIFAHIERYSYLVSNPKLLDDLLSQGVIFQCNATSLFSRHHRGVVKKLLKKGYVQLLASDTHSTKMRPPMLREALNKLKRYSGELISNSVKVVTDRII